ncbi:hypothetical protein BCF44_126108 [Kutzneria buriramensis]|uniref:Uncharacterized protein n=1 Tax=Kutzneria buriramensis TaxID=1045776 RepID=A0A3E0GWF2_9PSEU|nr:hypothetical protein BCF44_126108 [Kutzneria buriramensis]
MPHSTAERATPVPPPTATWLLAGRRRRRRPSRRSPGQVVHVLEADIESRKVGRHPRENVAIDSIGNLHNENRLMARLDQSDASSGTTGVHWRISEATGNENEPGDGAMLGNQRGQVQQRSCTGLMRSRHGDDDERIANKEGATEPQAIGKTPCVGASPHRGDHQVDAPDEPDQLLPESRTAGGHDHAVGHSSLSLRQVEPLPRRSPTTLIQGQPNGVPSCLDCGRHRAPRSTIWVEHEVAWSSEGLYREDRDCGMDRAVLRVAAGARVWPIGWPERRQRTRSLATRIHPMPPHECSRRQARRGEPSGRETARTPCRQQKSRLTGSPPRCAPAKPDRCHGRYS